MGNQEQYKQDLVIVKIGGNIIDDQAKLQGFLESFAGIPGYKILVHGGGKLATRLASQLGIPQQMIEGRRITDGETLKIITMVYAGLVNKNIVATLQSLQCNAIGLSGADANLIRARKREHPSIDYGFVGDIESVNAHFLNTVLGQNIAPVIAPVTHNGNGQLLNTNADTIAQEIARSLSDKFNCSLVYSFEKPGVLEDAADDSTVIPLIHPKLYEELKSGGKIFAGMIPKLDNAFKALNEGVSKVIIGQAENLGDILEGRSGTTITLNNP